MATHQLRAGMVGMGMIFDETYRPFFEKAKTAGVYDRGFGDVDVQLAAVASKTGKRAAAYLQSAGDRINRFENFVGDNAAAEMVKAGINFGCVATPDDRHFAAAKAVLDAGAHLLVEKPSVLRAYLRQWAFEVNQFFQGVGADAPDAEIARIAPGYPVFRIE